MEEMKKWISVLSQIKGVNSVLIINNQGSFVDGSIGEDQAKYISDLCLDLNQYINSISEKLKKPFTDAFFEFEGKGITLEKIMDNLITVIISDSDANLGKIRLEIKKIKSALQG